MPIDGVVDWRKVGGPDKGNEEPFSEMLWYVISSVAEAASRLLDILGSRATAESKEGYGLVGSIGLMIDERRIQSVSDGDLSNRAPAS